MDNSNQQKSVLLVEDDRLISEMYTRNLRKAGYKVDTAISGPEGMNRAITGNYDFILLDIMIPDQTGVEVLRQLRGREGNKLPNTNVIVMTNFDQDEKSRHEMEQLAEGYLIKAEITPKRLVEILDSFDQVPPQQTIAEDSKQF